MDAVTKKSVKCSPVSPFQFFPTTPQCPSLSPSSSPESSHVTALSYKDDPSPLIGLSLSPPCATSAQSEDDDHISPSAESAKVSADVSSHWKLPHTKTIKPQPSLAPVPDATTTEAKAAPSVTAPFPHFPAPAAAPVPFGHIPPYPAAAAAGWWAPFAAFPSHMLLAHSTATGQAQQQAMGMQQRPWFPNAPPWFCFGPTPFLSTARPALPAPGGAASDVNMEINKSLMAASKPSLSCGGACNRASSSMVTKASVKRSPSAKLATKPVEVLPRERLPSGFRPWKAASRSSGSNDTSALLSSNGATTTCSAAVEACASSRRAVPFALKPCSQGTEGLQIVKADGQPIRPAAQQPRGQAGPVNAVNTVNAATAINADRSGSGQHLCNACGLYLAKNDAPRPSVLWKKDSQGAPDNASHAVAAKA
ncbi:unnamed protein product [Closterium sp. Naga37s-1]|nr:unnamed protein product [Closterium sp. Naga37s-1]